MEINRYFDSGIVHPIPRRSPDDWRALIRTTSIDPIPYYDSAQAIHKLLKFCNLWGPGMRVLDLGSDHGRLAIGIASNGTERLPDTYIGLDVDSKGVVFSSAMLADFPMFSFRWLPVLSPHTVDWNPVKHGVTLDHPGVVKLKYPDSYFDSVICSALFSMIGTEADAKNILSEIRRVVRPGGRVLTSWYSPLDPPDSAHSVFPAEKIRRWLEPLTHLREEFGDREFRRSTIYILSKRPE